MTQKPFVNTHRLFLSGVHILEGNPPKELLWNLWVDITPYSLLRQRLSTEAYLTVYFENLF